MGGSGSKEDDDSNIYQRRYISWDQTGNLRYGLEHPVEPKRQLKEILELDFVDEEEGKVWYVMSSAWIASWLAYVKFARGDAPCPGPCRNDHLIQFDYATGKYIGRFGLFMATNTRAGDYRRVSKEVWERFKEYYPGSGPTIILEYKKENRRESGEFDPALWTIVDPPEPPADRANKKKKKKFAAISLGIQSKQKKKAEQEEQSALLRSSAESKDGDDPLPEGDASSVGLASMTKAEPKLGPGTVPFHKTAGAEKGDKPRFSVDSAPPGEDLAKRRESFFENVYFKE